MKSKVQKESFKKQKLEEYLLFIISKKDNKENNKKTAIFKENKKDILKLNRMIQKGEITDLTEYGRIRKIYEDSIRKGEKIHFKLNSNIENEVIDQMTKRIHVEAIKSIHKNGSFLENIIKIEEDKCKSKEEKEKEKEKEEKEKINEIKKMIKNREITSFEEIEDFFS